jgi:hypothetical protein
MYELYKLTHVEGDQEKIMKLSLRESKLREIF